MAQARGINFISTVIIASVASFSAAQAADDHVGPATAFAKSTIAKWVSDPMVIKAIKAQNAKNASMSQDQIIKADKKWRKEVDASSKPMISAIIKNSVSKYLVKKKNAAKGTITEVFIMDNKGLNVGQSDVTSDYWQGDEAKWKKTYLVGPSAIFVDDVEQDESTQQMQSQVSMSIKDPKTNAVIGAITVGINVDEL